MTDVIGAGRVDAPPRRRRLPRPVTWMVVAVLGAGAITVPYAKSSLADGAAGWLQDEWALRAAYDDARVVVIDAVGARAGVLDDGVVDDATRVVDRQEAAVLTRLADRMAGHRTWGGDVAEARDAAVRAVRAEVASLRADATARHPTTGYLYTLDVQNLLDVASGRVAAVARRHGQRPPASTRATLPPATAALAKLRLPTDVRTGLSLVLAGGSTGAQVIDLDTGTATPMRLPDAAEARAWSGRIMVITRTGVYSLAPGDPTRTRLTGPGQLLSATGSSWWLESRRGVRRFTAGGHPLTPWIRPPADRSPVTATDDVVVLTHVVDEASVVGEIWNPVTGETHALPVTCFGGWAAAAQTVVPLACPGDRTIRTVEARTGAVRRVRLPGRVSQGGFEEFSPLSPDGRRMAVVLGGDFRAGVVDLRTGRFHTPPIPTTLTPIGWSPDGQWVLLADQGTLGGDRRPRVALWRPRDGRMTSVRVPQGSSLLFGVQLISTSGSAE
ncbi:MAG TPA: hypothetical protein VFJ98_04325 [Mycobacteriales bacterium]|nr:hypothetical protein [Mycobacteriales bacterium]